MPIFEFICQECGDSFEELVRNTSQTLEVVCPSCQSAKVRKKVSTFASKVTGGSSPSFSSSPSCNTGST